MKLLCYASGVLVIEITGDADESDERRSLVLQFEVVGVPVGVEKGKAVMKLVHIKPLLLHKLQ